MSSPLAKSSKSLSDQLLIYLHRSVSHRHRIEVLADTLAQQILGLQDAQAIPSVARCLDVGCGDMTLSETIAAKIDGSVWCCVDVHPCDSEKREVDSRWKKYYQFDGINLPFEAGHFDVGIVSDVLHHVNDNYRCLLLRDIGRVCRYVIIKDHFEDGPYSRLMLRVMDFVGNYGYGVPVPGKYFTRRGFSDLCRDAGLGVLRTTVGIDLYGHLPLVQVFLRKKWHFLSICSKTNP